MKPHFKPSHPRKPVHANRIRIIGGQWRSRILDFPDGEGLRPTGNRIRETLFNWLGQTLHDRRCLDLFAGSGALGFEAASRGAQEVLLVEKSREAEQALRANAQRLDAANCRIVRGDALAFLESNRVLFDVIFLDPPFASGLMGQALAALPSHLAADGFVYAEWGSALPELLATMPETPWHVARQGQAGVVHFGLLTLCKGAS